jgi:hypothetical protein
MEISSVSINYNTILVRLKSLLCYLSE